MSHITHINHEKRKDLYLTILQYTIADIIQSFKKPVVIDDVCLVSDEPITTVVDTIQQLENMGLCETAPRSGKVSVTPLWKEQTKIKKEIVIANPLIDRFKKALISEKRKVDHSDYQWSVTEARVADELSKKLISSHRIKTGNEPTNEDIINSFCLIIDNLPEFHELNFSLSRINSDYNGVVSHVRSKLRGKGKIIAGANAINDAINEL